MTPLKQRQIEFLRLWRESTHFRYYEAGAWWAFICIGVTYRPIGPFLSQRQAFYAYVASVQNPERKRDKAWTRARRKRYILARAHGT